MQTAFESAQKTIEALTGQSHGELKGAPLDGPHDVDTAVSDFANRASRIARYMPMDTSEIAGASRDLLDAAQSASFGYLDLTNPVNLGFCWRRSSCDRKPDGAERAARPDDV